CRAIIPAGYMPDASRAQEGKFAVTFCTSGSENGTIFLDLHNRPDLPTSSDQVDNQYCPFGIVASQRLAPSQDMPALVGSISPRPALLPQHNQSLPPLPARGPPLGSRAPPSGLS